jgi:hypothetical protein
MTPPKAYRALFVTLLGITLGCGDPAAAEWKDEFGAVSEKVVGGWAATTDQIFATVEIRRAGADSGFCSGTLISPSVVVTAAHCAVVEPEEGAIRSAAPSSLQVVAGHLTSRAVTSSMVRSVFRVHVHEGYDHDFIMGRSRSGAGQGGIGSPHDIALLFLTVPFKDLPNAPMLATDHALQLLRHGDVGFVAGYGIYDLEDHLTGELYISDAVIDILGEQELMTRRADQLGDSCYGDSGGPLYVPTEEGEFLVGLVSRGRSDVKRDCGDGGVYTLLSAYLPWIVETAGSRFDPKPVSGGDVSFLAEGADTVNVTKGGALHRVGSCASSPSTSGERSPVSALALLLGFVLFQRRLSRL